MYCAMKAHRGWCLLTILEVLCVGWGMRGGARVVERENKRVER